MLTATGGAASSAASEARQRRGFLVKASPPKGSPVLANFTVEQSGSRVRLIDADGSVYEGEIGSIPTPEGPPAATLLARSTNAAPNMVAFAAMGTNATLRQPVRLTGQLYLESGLELGGQVMPTGFAGQNELQSRRLSLQDQAGRERNSPQVRGGQGPAQANRVQQTSSGQAQILRITGQARFGRTNAIAIDAIPNPR